MTLKSPDSQGFRLEYPGFFVKNTVFPNLTSLKVHFSAVFQSFPWFFRSRWIDDEGIRKQTPDHPSVEKLRFLS